MSGAVNVETWSGKDRGDENFPVGSALIRRDLRRHVHAFYAFARNADDIADSPTLAPEDKIARLDRMEAVLLGQADPDSSPSAARLAASLAATRVVATHATDLLVAFRRDATKNRYETWEELQNYCRYSAMPVGRHVLDLHGEGRGTWGASDALCTALQVLNHLQDCAADLRALDRCYLPRELMESHGAHITDLRRDACTKPLRAVLRALLAMTDSLNAHGAALPGRVRNRRLRLETAVIAGLSRRLADKLYRQDPLARRVRLRGHDVAGAVLGALRFIR
ncbi:MAG: squalene synthase HpnC [Rhodospirillales bacterium]|nr:squalene synthase HpnC [Rhodospirillales bacterium]